MGRRWNGQAVASGSVEEEATDRVGDARRFGDAFDLDPVSVSLDALADTCAEHGAGYVGVYVSHIHCDWRDDPVDLDFFGPERAALATVQPDLNARVYWTEAGLTTTADGWDEGEPLREWTAFASDGTILGEATVGVFLPPVGATRVRCTVGRAIDSWAAL